MKCWCYVCNKIYTSNQNWKEGYFLAKEKEMILVMCCHDRNGRYLHSIPERTSKWMETVSKVAYSTVPDKGILS